MNSSMVVRTGVAGLMALAVGCSSGPSDDNAGPSRPAVVRSYVGAAQGTSAFVAVVVDGSRVLAYVCDGVPADAVGTPPTVQAWFNAASDGATVDASQPAGRLQLRLTDAEMTGTLTLPGGRTLSVTGQAVTGDAGLYRAEAAGGDAKAVGGWILAADGQQRGAVMGEGGTLAKLSGARTLNLAQPNFTVQGLATARIAKVGITPIPIP